MESATPLTGNTNEYITVYTASQTKGQLLPCDAKSEIAPDQVRFIRVCSGESLGPIPKTALTSLLSQYPNTEKIIFGPPKDHLDGSEFNAHAVPCFQELTNLLGKAPSSHLEAVQFREISYGNDRDFDESKSKTLHRRLLRAIGHPGLKKLRITASTVQSCLTKDEIQPALDKSPNLETFVFDGFQSEQSVALSFAKQPNLSKVKLLDWHGPSSTIKSLKDCKKLEVLVIDAKNVSTLETIKAQLKDDCWNLRRLELKGVVIQTDEELDAITKNQPNLESLQIDLSKVSANGIEHLGKNCPHLKVLELTDRSLTNSKLDRLTKHLPNLEVIDIHESSEITGNGIEALAKNCRKLRSIQVADDKHMGFFGIQALINYCPDLLVIGFSSTFFVPSLPELIQARPNLQYVQIDPNYPLAESFYKEFPHIQPIPPSLNVRKFCRKPLSSTLKKENPNALRTLISAFTITALFFACEGNSFYLRGGS